MSKTFQTAQNTVRVIDSILGHPPESIEIISQFPHTRRTYLSYKKCLPEMTQIGIVSINEIYPSSIRYLRNIREILGIIYVKAQRRK
jgi:uncharacterized SAM-binding protein YcdF (DUF218 family)